MSDRQAFDYVVVQIVPRVDRDERLNVGVILYCPAAAFLGCRFWVDDARLQAVALGIDLAAVKGQVAAIQTICAGSPDGGPIAGLSPSERFHWLSAPRSTVVQPSPAHTGLCDDPKAALDSLFKSAVAPCSVS